MSDNEFSIDAESVGLPRNRNEIPVTEEPLRNQRELADATVNLRFIEGAWHLHVSSYTKMIKSGKAPSFSHAVKVARMVLEQEKMPKLGK